MPKFSQIGHAISLDLKTRHQKPDISHQVLKVGGKNPEKKGDKENWSGKKFRMSSGWLRVALCGSGAKAPPLAARPNNFLFKCSCFHDHSRDMNWTEDIILPTDANVYVSVNVCMYTRLHNWDFIKIIASEEQGCGKQLYTSRSRTAAARHCVGRIAIGRYGGRYSSSDIAADAGHVCEHGGAEKHRIEDSNMLTCDGEIVEGKLKLAITSSSVPGK